MNAAECKNKSYGRLSRGTEGAVFFYPCRFSTFFPSRAARELAAFPGARSSWSVRLQSAVLTAGESRLCPFSVRCRCCQRSRKNAQLASQWDDVSNRVKTGGTLSSAFEAPRAVSRSCTPPTLLAGERSGNLQEGWSATSAFRKSPSPFRKKMIASLIYPALLLHAGCRPHGVSAGRGVRQFAVLYDQMGKSCPP